MTPTFYRTNMKRIEAILETLEDMSQPDALTLLRGIEGMLMFGTPPPMPAPFVQFGSGDEQPEGALSEEDLTRLGIK